MKTARIFTATIKATGEQVQYEAKIAWGKMYYSFDGGTSWHLSKAIAYRLAKREGKI